MIAALIAAGAVATALVTLAIYAITATRRAGNEQAAHARLDEQLKAALANEKTQSARADFEKERADALDAAIAREAADAVGPVAGSFAKLLQEAAALKSRRAGTDVVRDAGAASDAPGADRRGPDDLLRPGE